jgi:hypothetical protein
MPLIFLSYFRRDSQVITEKIYDSLTDAYGNETIFLDTKSIPKKEDIREYIREEINQCAVVLAIISSRWLKLIEDSRLDLGDWEIPKSWVGLELEEALSMEGSRVLPLLVDTTMPKPNMLPKRLQKLTYQNGLLFNSSVFHEEMPRLVRVLDGILDGSSLALPEYISTREDDVSLRRRHYSHEVRHCLESYGDSIDVGSKIYLNALRDHLGLNSNWTENLETTNKQIYERYKYVVSQSIKQKVNSGSLTKEDQVEIISKLLDRRSIASLRRLHENLGISRYSAKKIERQILRELRVAFESKTSLKQRITSPGFSISPEILISILSLYNTYTLCQLCMLIGLQFVLKSFLLTSRSFNLGDATVITVLVIRYGTTISLLDQVAAFLRSFKTHKISVETRENTFSLWRFNLWKPLVESYIHLIGVLISICICNQMLRPIIFQSQGSFSILTFYKILINAYLESLYTIVMYTLIFRHIPEVNAFLINH